MQKPEINPWIYSQLIFDKVAKKDISEKGLSLHHMVLVKLDITEDWNLTSILTLYKNKLKITSKVWNYYLKNMEETMQYTVLVWLKIFQKHKKAELTNGIKLKNCIAKETIKRQPTEWENVFFSCSSNRIFKIYKELKKLI